MEEKNTELDMFPPVVDDSMMATFRNCPQKFYWEYIQHYKSPSPSVHLHAGAAFASGLEATREAYYVEKKDEEESIAIGMKVLMEEYGDFECPEKSAKSCNRMMGALEYYFTNFRLDADEPTMLGGKRAIEFSFSNLLPFTNPQSGMPVIYSGRSDMIVRFAGQDYIEDDKTTTSLGPTWGNKWDIRGQFTGYCWGAQQYNIDIAGVLVRGVSILKTKYDHQQAITYRPQFMIDRWLEQMVVDLEHIAKNFKTGFWQRNQSDMCDSYGGCSFKRCCLSENPQPWLDTYFAPRVWDPLNRKEVAVTDWRKEWDIDKKKK